MFYKEFFLRQIKKLDMYALILIPLITFVALAAFVWSRRIHEKRLWMELTQTECVLLLTSLAGAVQALYVTIVPGWIVAAYVVGKGNFAQTPFGNEVFGTVTIIANTIIYFPFFYLLLGLLFRFFRESY